MIVFREGHWIGREAPQLRRENLTFITGRVLVAVEALIDGMADFLQQHRLQLAGGSALQPVGIYVYAFSTTWCGIGIGAINVIEDCCGQDFQGNLEAALQQAGLQIGGSWPGGGGFICRKYPAEQGVIGV
jgi:hypothetical protein